MGKFLQEFREFAIRGNMVDMAVGIIVGTAFTNLVNALVKNVVTPPIGLLLGKVDFSNLYLNLSGQEYDSLAAAQEAGAPTLNYGLFINATIDFLILALVVFLLVRQINNLRRKHEAAPPPEPHLKECQFCLSKIAAAATRCPMCTSELQASH